MVQAAAQTTATVAEVVARIKPRRVEGISALLLPYREDGRPDLEAFAEHLQRTARAGLRPSVNMDTGYVHLLSADERLAVLRTTREVLGGRSFVAGAFVEDQDPPASVDGLVTRYCHEAELVREFGGTPIIFQCSAMKALSDADLVGVYRAVAERMGEVIAFELGEMFAPFGRIYSFEVFSELIGIPNLVGIKHSSLDRAAEWQRLELRDRVRPEFRVYTGNDLGIDMIMYGSDYLLGLSTFAPGAFGLRDRYWAEGDARFYALNDTLQYLGTFGFRPPVPAYRHSAAQFLHLRGQLPSSATHPNAPRRPDSDLPILRQIAERLEELEG